MEHIKPLLSKILTKQFLIYLVVGFSTAFLDLFLYWFLIQFLQIWYLLAAAITNPIVLSFNFFSHRWFTFKSQDSKKEQVPKYILLNIFNYFVGLLVLYVLVDLLKFNYMVGKVLTIVVIVAYNFLVLKFFVFRTDPSSKP